jgi:ABC-type glycerol-3-phosphate transport system substrate-binding protein
MKMSTKKVAVAAIASLAITTIAYAGSAIAATTSTTLNLYHDKKGWDSRFLGVSSAINDGVGIKLKPSTYADTTIYQNTLNQAAKTGKGPDLLTWWSGYRMVDGAKNGIFADITDVWTAAIKAGDVSADLQKQFQVGGKTYGIPNGVSFWPMFYNKKVFAANNLTVPKTWAEFINICDTLKAKGITPLTASVDGAWPAFIWFEQLLISQDPQLYLDLTSNKIKYTDPKIKAVLQIWKDMIDKGYFTAGDTSFFGEAAVALMNKGTMIPVGTWNNSAFSVTGNLVGGKDYDAFVIPNINPALKNQSIIVEAGAIGALAKGKNLAKAKVALREWLKFPAQAMWADVSGDGVPNPKVPVADPVIKSLSKYVAANHVNQIQRYWESGPVPLIENGCSILSAFMLGNKTVDEVSTEMAALADKEWKAWTAKYGK